MMKSKRFGSAAIQSNTKAKYETVQKQCWFAESEGCKWEICSNQS